MRNFKQIAEEWAEKTLKEAPQRSFDETAEQLLFGSLLYAQNEKGEKVWLKRITGNETFEVKPVSVINGQIKL